MINFENYDLITAQDRETLIRVVEITKMDIDTDMPDQHIAVSIWDAFNDITDKVDLTLHAVVAIASSEITNEKAALNESNFELLESLDRDTLIMVADMAKMEDVDTEENTPDHFIVLEIFAAFDAFVTDDATTLPGLVDLAKKEVEKKEVKGTITEPAESIAGHDVLRCKLTPFHMNHPADQFMIEMENAVVFLDLSPYSPTDEYLKIDTGTDGAKKLEVITDLQDSGGKYVIANWDGMPKFAQTLGLF